MKLGILLPAYYAEEFDLEILGETPKKLFSTSEAAKAWGESMLHEGREPTIKWNFTHHVGNSGDMFVWTTMCNEYGSFEEWILMVENISE